MIKLVLLVLGLGLAACNTSKSLPDTMTGSFVRTDPALIGTGASRARLEVTATEITLRPAGTGMETAGSAIKGGAVRDAKAVDTAVKLESVSCKGESCRFSGEGCEGTMTKDEAGDLTVTATGACASLSGKWLGPSSAGKGIIR